MEVFLDRGGLETIGEMLQRLPNGTLPNPTFRAKVYELILSLPVLNDHLMETRVGRVLTTIEKSSNEVSSNLQLISKIKERWGRILCLSKQEDRRVDMDEHRRDRPRNRGR